MRSFGHWGMNPAGKIILPFLRKTRRKILEDLNEGKITSEEAMEMLS